jgi:hypothetical protein
VGGKATGVENAWSFTSTQLYMINEYRSQWVIQNLNDSILRRSSLFHSCFSSSSNRVEVQGKMSEVGLNRFGGGGDPDSRHSLYAPRILDLGTRRR